MSKSLKKAALIIGVAALAFTGIGMLAIPAFTTGMTALALGSLSISFGTLGMLGVGLIGLGTSPTLDQSIENTGANARGQAFVDPNAQGAYVFGRTSVPRELIDAES